MKKNSLDWHTVCIKELFKITRGVVIPKNEIETELGYSVKWDYKEGSKASSVDIRSDFRLDLKNNDLSKGYQWLLNKAEDFKRVFRKYL